MTADRHGHIALRQLIMVAPTAELRRLHVHVIDRVDSFPNEKNALRKRFRKTSDGLFQTCVKVVLVCSAEDGMSRNEALIAEVYSAFNQRDVQRVLSFMSEKVSWPKASEGGRVVGKSEIDAYWTRQWQEFDPIVEPIEVNDEGDEITSVRVHQLVKSLGGEVLSDDEVCHVYTIANGLIERMDIKGAETNAVGAPSAAFSRR